MSKKRQSMGRRLLILAGWLMVWQIVSLLCHNSILMVGPVETGMAFFQNMMEESFWRTLGTSYARILAGLLAGIICGMGLSAISYRWKLLEEIWQPFMTLIKAIPVASFTVLLLIWWGAPYLSVSICFLVVLPNIYVNALEGLKSTDRKLLEMAEVFRMPWRNRLFYIYRPALKPFLESGLKIAIGMAWKSGVAAEVIGTPDHSIGERLYLSKIYLDTADVLAWTAAAILLSVVTEKLFLWMMGKVWAWEPGCRKPALEKREGEKHLICLRADHINKSFQELAVLSDYSEIFEKNKMYYFQTPSGSGKTTLFRILAGLEQPDNGRVTCEYRVTMMFQEDRLCEDYSAVKNVELVTGDKESAGQALCRLLPKDALDKPVCQLSGGMRRRVALVRAMEAEGTVCLLDEPFTGLDEENRQKAAAYIGEKGRGRAVLIATHENVMEK
ncbi:MAG: ATP-binding cassette domain-containing protein [Lachnospiraceae bacterium]|nr:ATP-binding cassette domain-containing protein [Lachnospiraceae bacterium]